ncbi:hypothetical protein M0804_002128 [Polistes exclamans]|nr:hypothetical protein M0804_002128 [Polistes exclamans]
MHTSLSQDTNGTTSIFWQAYETLLQNMLEYNARETRIQIGIRTVCYYTYQGIPKHSIEEFNKMQKPLGMKGLTIDSVKIISETSACGAFRRFAQSQLL